MTATPIADALEAQYRKVLAAPVPWDALRACRGLERKLSVARETLAFIRDECDWEPRTGDARIGPACVRALEKIEP